MRRVLSRRLVKAGLLVVGDMVEGLLVFLEVRVVHDFLGTACLGGGGAGGRIGPAWGGRVVAVWMIFRRESLPSSDLVGGEWCVLL